MMLWPVAVVFLTFNVVDDFNREALSIEIDLNLPALRVVRVLSNDSNLLIVFYVQIMPDDFVMQLHRF